MVEGRMERHPVNIQRSGLSDYHYKKTPVGAAGVRWINVSVVGTVLRYRTLCMIIEW